MVQGEPGAPDLFWGELARARLRWSREFDRLQDCELTQGRLQWFIGGQLNVSGKQWLDEHSGYTHTRTPVMVACWRIPSWITGHLQTTVACAAA